MSDSAGANTALAARRIDVAFTFAPDPSQGVGAGAGAETVTLSDYRVACQVLSTGLETGMVCTLRIEGMPPTLVNRLSAAQVGVVAQGRNSVTVMAGEAEAARPVIFSGGIVEAFVEYETTPDAVFVVQAHSIALPAALPVSPTSFGRDASVATIMAAIAAKAGLGFVNNGVQTVLRGGVYYKGAATEQIDACARAGGVSYHIGMGRLCIWPFSMEAAREAAVPVSVATGLIGYPAYSQYGVGLRMLFNPGIGFRDTISLQSAGSSAQGVALPATGLWVVQSVQHRLQSGRTQGPWFTLIEAARPDLAGQGFAQ
jgi:hypothetical protein